MFVTFLLFYFSIFLLFGKYLKKIIIFCEIQSSSFFKKVYFLFFTFILFLFIFKILSNYFMRKKRRKENELKVILESPFSNPISSVVSIPPPSLSWFLTVNFLSPVSLSNNAVWIGPTIHSNHNTPFLFSSLFIVILFFSLGFVNFCSSPSSPSPSLSLSLYLSISVHWWRLLWRTTSCLQASSPICRRSCSTERAAAKTTPPRATMNPPSPLLLMLWRPIRIPSVPSLLFWSPTPMVLKLRVWIFWLKLWFVTASTMSTSALLNRGFSLILPIVGFCVGFSMWVCGVLFFCGNLSVHFDCFLCWFSHIMGFLSIFQNFKFSWF